MAKGKKVLTPMEILAKKAQEVLKGKQVSDITKEDFNKAIKKAAKPKGRAKG